jgi:hypothetical protein
MDKLCALQPRTVLSGFVVDCHLFLLSQSIVAFCVVSNFNLFEGLPYVWLV